MIFKQISVTIRAVRKLYIKRSPSYTSIEWARLWYTDTRSLRRRASRGAQRLLFLKYTIF